MKKILFYAVIFLTALSCSNDDLEGEEGVDGKEYMAKIGFEGEISISESPLLKSTGSDLYGVQVYVKDNGSGEYKPYAYGLFDDPSLMDVKLIGGNIYKFESTMIEDGKNRIYYSSSAGYYSPFDAIKSSYAPLNNKFIYSSSDFMRRLSWGLSDLENGGSFRDSYSRPNTVRFYGLYSDYKPSDNNVVTINMKKVCFGAKFVVEGLTEGKVVVDIEDAPKLEIAHPAVSIQDIFTFEGSLGSESWINDDYSELVPVSISWHKSDGSVKPVSSSNINFKRNKLTTITVKLSGDNPASASGKVNISLEDKEMQPGDNIVVGR
nr:MAG: hypothetical protein [Bacteriophage sp.]